MNFFKDGSELAGRFTRNSTVVTLVITSTSVSLAE